MSDHCRGCIDRILDCDDVQELPPHCEGIPLAPSESAIRREAQAQSWADSERLSDEQRYVAAVRITARGAALEEAAKLVEGLCKGFTETSADYRERMASAIRRLAGTPEEGDPGAQARCAGCSAIEKRWMDAMDRLRAAEALAEAVETLCKNLRDGYGVSPVHRERLEELTAAFRRSTPRAGPPEVLPTQGAELIANVPKNGGEATPTPERRHDWVPRERVCRYCRLVWTPFVMSEPCPGVAAPPATTVTMNRDPPYPYFREPVAAPPAGGAERCPTCSLETDVASHEPCPGGAVPVAGEPVPCPCGSPGCWETHWCVKTKDHQPGRADMCATCGPTLKTYAYSAGRGGRDT